MSDSNQSNAVFFIQESIRAARAMAIPEARTYLRGLVELVGENDLVADIRHALILLDESDRQLELIQSLQLKLRLKEDKR